ncbi:cytochrome P450 [Zopfia rhizophila CBS 207.26]|uniref:Cytochrome P450 n=1 Tax=Zopfia rhizophila CBS 207.26 TaxID=1314779 RepID=A0A6A6ED01_9PEZI|nr:cytochrome P450 [Zopfia rhizophila CBS 207.26]
MSLHSKYGPLVRIAPNEVSIADLPAIKQIYGSGSRFRKSDWYSVWQGHRKFDLFAGRDEKVHGQQRKLVARAYAMETLKDLEPYVDDAIEVFMRKMREQIPGRIDMSKWAQLFAFDVIGEVTFSKSFGFMENSKDDGTFAAIGRAARSGSWLGQVSWLFWLHDALMPYIGNHLGVNNRHGGLRNFALRETASRKERPSAKKDIVGRLFQTSAEKPGEMDYNDVVSMATSNITAGSDTTGISMRAIIYFLLKNPEAKRRLIEEIDQRRRKGELSDPVSWNEANKMKYLQACMHEALRLHPAVGVNLPRVVPPGGTEIHGHYFPAGSIVGVNAWVVHRNKEVYGEDAEEFRPERRLKEDIGDMQRSFFSFGAGSRSCIGRNISWLEMSKLIPTLFLRYDVALADPYAEWSEHCQFFVHQTNFDVKLTPRKHPAT